MAVDKPAFPYRYNPDAPKKKANPSPRRIPNVKHSPMETRHLVIEQGEDNTNQQVSPNEILYDRWHQTGSHTIIEIEWLDAISTGDDWTADQDLDLNPAPSLSVGYLVSDNPTSITIASLVNAEWWGQGITIPKGCIIQTRLFK